MIAEPVASIAPRSPMRWSSPNAIASFPIWSTALSPRSSPNATLILSAASTNSSMPSLEVIPKRPAAPASSLSCSRDERVSIFLKSSFSSRTCSSVCPVYFRVFAMTSSMEAKASEHMRTVCVSPVSAAQPCTTAPQFLFSPSMNPLTSPLRCSGALSWSLTSAICFFNRLDFSASSSNAFVPWLVSRSCSFTICRAYSKSRIVAPLRFLSVWSMTLFSLATTAWSFVICCISLSYLSMVRFTCFCRSLTSCMRVVTFLRFSACA